MLLVDAEQAQLFRCRVKVCFEVGLCCFRLFKSTLGDCSFVVQNLSSLQLRATQTLVILCLQVSLVRSRDVVALHSKQELSLLHCVAEPGLNLNHSS